VISLAIYSTLPETKFKDSEGGDSNGVVKEEEEKGEWIEFLKGDDRWKGLVLCEMGAKFGFAAKLASIPILASILLPGGATAAGTLLSLTGLSGLLCAPLGGTLVDSRGAPFAAGISGLLSAVGLLLIPIAIYWHSINSSSVILSDGPFVLSVLLWGGAVAVQGPALTAVAQELSPKGKEATGTALPRAAGDAMYLVAPSALGFVADASRVGKVPLGAECGMAGFFVAMGVLAFYLSFKDKDGVQEIGG